MKKVVITICSSASFYRQAIEVQAQLTELGFKAIIPMTAEKMKRTGDFNVEHYKTWYENQADYHKKTELIRAHFTKVSEGDAVLILNYEKHGMPNYIGGNVLMEMAIAFYLKKSIFILNDLPAESPFLEEIVGLNPILLKGKLENLSLTL